MGGPLAVATVLLLGAFEGEQQLNLDVGNTDQGAPDIAARPGLAAWVVYGSNAAGDYDVYFTCTSNGGASGSWSTPTRIVSGAGDQGFPRIASSIDGADVRVHVAWRNVVPAGGTEGDVGYAIFRAPLTSPCALTAETSPFVADDLDDQSFLEMDVGFDGTAYLTWRECPAAVACSTASGYRVEVGTFAPGGGGFSSISDLTETPSSFDPDVAVLGTTTNSVLWVVFARPGGDGSLDVAARWSTNAGLTFSSSVFYGAGATDVRDPTIAATGPEKALLAHITGTQLEARLLRRTPTGISSTAPVPVSATASAFAPHVSALDRTGHALLGWESGFDVYAALTTDTGATWSQQGPIGTTVRNQTNARGALGSAFLVYQSDQDQPNRLESFFTRDVSVTAVLASGFVARESRTGVELSWSLGVPALVAEVALARDGVPVAIEERSRALDEDGRAGDRYLLRVTGIDGSVQELTAIASHGPAAGCAAGEGSPGASLLALLVLACRRRGGVCSRR